MLDLDGTLIDPLVGITSSYRAMIDELGLEVPSDEILRSFIGPPLRECIRGLLPEKKAVSASEVEELVGRYRHYYVEQKFMLRDRMYPAIPDVLQQLSDRGHRLFVATSKAHLYARVILQHFGLEKFFTHVYGSELNGDRSDKAQLIAHLIENEGLKSEDCVMVGDRKHDVRGALANNMSCIGVTYGYGTAQELKDAGALAVIAQAEDLPDSIARIS